MSTPVASSSQLWPIENFGVVPMLTSVTLSFSPGLATISVTLNFIVSLPVISMARPSWTCVAGALGAEDEPAAGAVAPDSPAGGAEHPAPRVAMKRVRSARYRVMDILPAVQSRPARQAASLSQSNKHGHRVPGPGTGYRVPRIADRGSGIADSGVGRQRSEAVHQRGLLTNAERRTMNAALVAPGCPSPAFQSLRSQIADRGRWRAGQLGSGPLPTPGAVQSAFRALRHSRPHCGRAVFAPQPRVARAQRHGVTRAGRLVT